MENWSNQFLSSWLALSPMDATLAGEHLYDDRWGNIGLSKYHQMELFLRKQHPPNDGSQTYRAISFFIKSQLMILTNKDYYYDLGSLGTTFQALIRSYQMTLPQLRSERYRLFPQALQDYIDVLREGLQLNKVVPKREVRAVLQQCHTYQDLLPLRPFVIFLQNEYLPYATTNDGVGLTRYQRAVYSQTGGNVDLHDLYHWGYREIKRITQLIAAISAQPAPSVTTEREFFAILTKWQKEAYNYTQPYFPSLSGMPLPNLKGDAIDNQTMFDPSTNTIEYSSQYPRSLQNEMSVAFHEGIPGHYLQLNYPDARTKLERLLINSGVFTEGYALYAETLMEELGIYRMKPCYYLKGRYYEELVRCYRIVIDIGLHLGWTNLLTRKKWDYNQAVNHLHNDCKLPLDLSHQEVLRYISIPAQALCYKLGERLILEARDRWFQRGGSLRDFHQYLLTAGSLDYPSLLSL